MNNVFIHCKTKEQACIFSKTMQKWGITWVTQRLFTPNTNKWTHHGAKTTYCVGNEGLRITYCERIYSKSRGYLELKWDDFMRCDNVIDYAKLVDDLMRRR